MAIGEAHYINNKLHWHDQGKGDLVVKYPSPISKKNIKKRLNELFQPLSPSHALKCTAVKEPGNAHELYTNIPQEVKKGLIIILSGLH